MRLSRSSWSWAMFGTVLISMSVTPPVQGKPAAKTIAVDCTKGESINAALSNTQPNLVIEIHGMCNEDVLVLRSDVTLRGTNPNTDGIAGVAGPPTGDPNAPGVILAALDIRANRITVENLKLTNGAAYGINGFNAQQIDVKNCVFTANHSVGANFTLGSFAQIFDSTATGNEGNGIRVGGNAIVFLVNTVSKNNLAPGNGPDTALAIVATGRAAVEGGELTGKVGIGAGASSNVSVFSTSITGTNRAVALSNTATGILDLLTVNGRIVVSGKAKLDLFGVTQATTTGTNVVSDDALLRLSDEEGPSGPVGSILLGRVTSTLFSQVVIEGLSGISGNLTCSRGGDAWCETPGNITGTANCGQCTKP